MHTHLRSAQIIPTLLALVWVLQGCATRSNQSNQYKPAHSVDSEVSLKEDRTHLDHLRQNTPEEVAQENDELAYILKNMSSMDQPPYRINSRFNTAFRKRQNNFRKATKKERDLFGKEEKKARDEFLRKAKKERDRYYSKKPDRESMREFSRDQDQERREFFANQRDRRKDFDAQMRDRRRDFDAQMRDLRRDFLRSYREYQKSYSDKKKAERLKKKAKSRSRYQITNVQQRSQDPDQKEFADPYNGPRVRLQPDEE